MKFYFPVLLAALISYTAVAQKKELKAAQKLVDASLYQKALVALDEMQPLIKNAEAKYSSHYYYLLGISKQKNKAFDEAIAAFDKANSIEESANLKKYSSLIQGNVSSLTNDLINEAVDLNSSEEYVAASKLLYTAYELDPQNNKDYLYYAASSAVNGGDYDTSLSYYLRLKDLNYEGRKTTYYATEVSSGEESEVPDAATFAIYKKSKEFTNLREELSDSKLPEIVKNIALIYVQKGDNEAAMQAVKDARSMSPKDVGLILTEADLYNKIGDEARFASLMEEAIAQDPNNAVLYYNLGVVNGNKGNREASISYYKKAIELDPNYEATYLNLASVILEGEAEIVEEMNTLGTSASDNRKYDALKQKREGLFLEAVPYLETLVSINPNNADALTTLKNIFGTIGDTANFKKYRDMLDSL
ncbi:MAG: tetratricopeptide repeat protein [Flavobacteriaceae bacterium]|jgi:tetratricopeptide (TPR) repeat protein|nr:tetratricopeptide repeat protein [Flavobacteriaceae bacterium]MDG2290348.1 tetratricopeptide repeat protein [Flavobacteriaceae bacterium]